MVAIERRYNTDSEKNKKGLISFKLISTSVIGSYLVMRGFSTLIGGYPSEADMIRAWYAES